MLFQAGNPQPVRAIVLILDPVLTPFLYFAVPNVWCVSSLATVGWCTETNVLVPADQIELASPPFDSVSSVRFSPTNPSHLLASSWDTVCCTPSLIRFDQGQEAEGIGVGWRWQNAASRMIYSYSFPPRQYAFMMSRRTSRSPNTTIEPQS